ncbi:thioesterase family protein [Mesorhizobium sp. B2-4-6]|uniref:thioesterase family protein n=1 Tax=Mesorhizobium sp. B2-4-6 TaxID=2589943 RepID=UPI00112AFA7D|nr:thioesterase family protein [Mesorhizobium sp. B2-4-6]TPL43514.1 thioesterase [Mesorhizobium sp. B2-4-6]
MAWEITWQGQVESDWLDELDHVNFLAYQRVAEKGGEVFWTAVSGGLGFKERHGTEYVLLEIHVRYLGELRLGEVVTLETALLAHDDKRYQLLHRLSRDSHVVCTVETVNLAFDLTTRRSMAFGPGTRAALDTRSSKLDGVQAELPLKRMRTIA